MENPPLRYRIADTMVGLWKGHGSFTLVSLSALILALPFGPTWTLIGVIVGIVGIVIRFFVRPSYGQLLTQSQKSDQQIADASNALETALASILRGIATHCALDESHQRLSVYFYSESDEDFVLLARHSRNPTLNTPGRSRYPAAEGVIGVAWKKGEGLGARFPASRIAWEVKQVRDFGYPEATAREIRMQSRSLAGSRITHGSTHLGVLVMESLNPLGVRQRNLDQAKESLLLQSLGEILNASWPLFPKLSELAKRP